VLPEDGGARRLAKREARPAGLEPATPGLEGVLSTVDDDSFAYLWGNSRNSQEYATANRLGGCAEHEGPGFGIMSIVSSTRLTARDRKRLVRARQRGRQHALRPTAVVRARYNAARRALELTLRSGEVRAIPRNLLPSVESVPAATLRTVTVSPSGDAISWRALDLDVSVRGLLRRASQAARVDFNARGRQAI
jgi:Protein of unknown function (DUF2442)